MGYFVDWPWSECDLCKAEIGEITVVAQGATGRFCPVLAVCQDCAYDVGYTDESLLSIEDARAKCDATEGGWADF